MVKNLLVFLLSFSFSVLKAEDGYRLWLRYEPVANSPLAAEYRRLITGVHFTGSGDIAMAAKAELETGIAGMLGMKLPEATSETNGTLLVGSASSSATIKSLTLEKELEKAGDEGFVVKQVTGKNKRYFVITANSDAGVLRGVFSFLRLIQMNQSIAGISVVSAPDIKFRLLNHWDNLNRSVERGYAGISIFDWHRLPGYVDRRITDYARANASIGINGSVITNVNANALILTREYLEKTAALAQVFRRYGIRLYLTARFSAPIELGGLKTADPLDPAVREWWKEKVNEIYRIIPDFGGFLVKANSEGQPGPQNYQRNHADGANMLAEAVGPHGGIVMWRAFVYSSDSNEDRFKQAYTEFKPLDGRFNNNVLLQVKNGPIDFQPREPFHPLFGAMPKTPLMMEFQLTQEYLGFATHLQFLSPLFKECLDADTYAKGKGSTVASIIDGSLDHHALTGMAGVANIGNERNWTGHLFGQSNWYALGRLAWDPKLTSEQIAEEWVRQTFGNSANVVSPAKQIMLMSREALVNYMTPLGLHHIMGYGHHYGPAPWYNKAPRADWNPVYFHKADSLGLGFDRTLQGSNALDQYTPEVRAQFGNVNACPDEYLLWFHHVSWDHKMHSGRTLWEELCFRYNKGVEEVASMQSNWNKVQGLIDEERFDHVKQLLSVQHHEAAWWRDACLLYFQRFSKKEIPAKYPKPLHTLEYYEELTFPYAPGN